MALELLFTVLLLINGPVVDEPVVGAAVCRETSGATRDAEGKMSIPNSTKAAPTDKARLRSDAVVTGDAARSAAVCEALFSCD